MPPTPPTAEQAHAFVTEQMQRLRLRTSHSSLSDLNNEVLLAVENQERTFLHPEHGIVTATEGEPYIIAGCGHKVSVEEYLHATKGNSASAQEHIAGRCNNRWRHRKNPTSAIVCKKCLRRCARCQVLYCAACTRFDFQNHMYYCISCYRLRSIGKLSGFLGGLLLLALFEPPHTEHTMEGP